eukprot:5481314-Amphidinium_carterae.1
MSNIFKGKGRNPKSDSALEAATAAQTRNAAVTLSGGAMAEESGGLGTENLHAQVTTRMIEKLPGQRLV